MMSKKLVFASLLGMMMSAHAEEEADAAGAAAEVVLNTASNGFVIICAVLVILMSVPGIGLFYAGLARVKNSMSVLAQCLMVFCVAYLMWTVCGYTMAFAGTDGPLGAFIGPFDKAFLMNVTPDTLSDDLSEYAYITFQGAFCAISSCLIVGATVERIKFSALVIGILLWGILSYVPLAHMVWGGGFIDATFAPYDFAGGDVVHVNAAVAGIVAAFMLGKRQDLGKANLAPHNLTLTYIGCGMLYLGWFGFNAGSELVADGTSSMALFNTVICPAAAAVAWALFEYKLSGKCSTLGMCSGILAGLVAITPACAFIGPIGAIVTGVIASAVCLWGVRGFKRMTKIDDSLDVFGIHGLGAFVGAIMTGIFCDPRLGGVGFNGDYTSIFGQVYGQAASCLISMIWSGIATFIAFKIAALLCGGLRVTPENEREGLDIVAHGERGYNL